MGVEHLAVKGMRLEVHDGLREIGLDVEYCQNELAAIQRIRVKIRKEEVREDFTRRGGFVPAPASQRICRRGPCCSSLYCLYWLRKPLVT